MPLVAGLVFTGLVATALAGHALRRWAGSFAVLAFLFSGGLGDPDPLGWKNLFLALYVTQRGFLFALPAGLLLLESFRRRFFSGTEPPLPAWVEGLVWGVLWPALTGTLNWAVALRNMFGVTLVAGSVAAITAFLIAERRWRRVIPVASMCPSTWMCAIRRSRQASERRSKAGSITARRT